MHSFHSTRVSPECPYFNWLLPDFTGKILLFELSNSKDSLSLSKMPEKNME